MGGAALFFVLGVAITQQLSSGTITIESTQSSVPIRIMKGHDVYKELTVTEQDKSVRVGTGRYTVEVDGNEDVVVENGTVRITRGGKQVVRIVAST